jgi:hypothetical protein
MTSPKGSSSFDLVVLIIDKCLRFLKMHERRKYFNFPQGSFCDLPADSTMMFSLAVIYLLADSRMMFFPRGNLPFSRFKNDIFKFTFQQIQE